MKIKDKVRLTELVKNVAEYVVFLGRSTDDNLEEILLGEEDLEDLLETMLETEKDLKG